MRSRWIRAAVLGAAAFFGLVGAHAIDYFLLYAGPARRSVLLQTGHSYFGKAFELGMAAAILAAIASFALGFTRDSADRSRRSPLRVAAVLALIQSGGFIALEAAERVIARAPAGQITRILVLGVVLQAAIATVTAFALSMLERAGQIVARALAKEPPFEQPVTATWRPREAARPKIALLARASPRAPPVAPVL
jgi:hypothetical protein